ncbi:acyl-CoA dehydrogenase family protein [Cupriavidus basilensis]
MNFNLDSEQQLLQDSVRRFIDRDYDFEARTALIKSGSRCSAKHWDTFANNGWLAAALPEAHGGLGGSLLDTVLIAGQLGRGLVIEPYLGCAVLAAQTLLAAATPTQRDAMLPEAGRRLAQSCARLQRSRLPWPARAHRHVCRRGVRRPRAARREDAGARRHRSRHVHRVRRDTHCPANQRARWRGVAPLPGGR